MRVLEPLKRVFRRLKSAGSSRKPFTKWTIPTQLVLGFGILVLLLIGISIASHTRIRRLHQDVYEMLDNEPFERAVLEMEINMNETARAVLDYIWDHSENSIDRMHDSQRDFERYAMEFERLAEGHNEQALGRQVAALYAIFKERGENITLLSKQRQDDLDVFRKDVEEIDELIDEKLQPAIDNSSTYAFTKLEAALEMEINIDEAFAAIEGYVLKPAPDLREKIIDSENDFKGFEAQYRVTPLSPDEKKWLDEINTNFNEAVRAGVEIIAFTDKLHEELKKFDFELEEIDRILDDEVQPLIRAEHLRVGADAGSVARTANQFSILVGIAGSLFGIFCAWAMARRILVLIGTDARLATVVRDSFDAITVQNSKGRILSWNQGSEKMYGYTEAEAVGMNVRELFPVDTRRDSESLIERLFVQGSGRESFDSKRVAKNGRELDVSVTATLLRGKTLDKSTVATTERDITERVESEKRFRSLALYDTLTGLPNRNLFQDRLEQSLKTARRQETKLGLLFLDLDGFKHVNDSLGHALGDALLSKVAGRLQRALRADDTVSRLESVESEPLSRLGGDEFTIILGRISNPQDIATVARRLMNALGAPIVLDGQEVYTAASIGISVFPQDGEDAETLMKNADSAMYHAKGNGANQFAFYEESMNVMATRKLGVSSQLHRALENQEFELHYQPLFDTQTRKLTGAEALLRWKDPEGPGLIPPADFIPIAEDTGLIVPIGKWVLRTACLQAREWHDAGFHSARMAVNVSSRQLRESSWIQAVTQILQETGLSPAQLELELTESAILQDDQVTIQNLRALHEMGISISLDDFGTGYSSLSYLNRFPIDRVKIDRSFIKGITADKANEALVVEAILTLAKSLQLHVVAEGVETEYQASFLRERACNELQGYLLGRPVPAHEFHRFLADQKVRI